MKQPVAKDGVLNSFLYGDDLPEQMKLSDEARRMEQKMKPKYSDKTSCSGKSRFADRDYK